MNREKPACFKAYDIRGRLPDELNEELAESIGRATAKFLRPKLMSESQFLDSQGRLIFNE